MDARIKMKFYTTSELSELRSEDKVVLEHVLSGPPEPGINGYAVIETVRGERFSIATDDVVSVVKGVRVGDVVELDLPDRCTGVVLCVDGDQAWVKITSVPKENSMGIKVIADHMIGNKYSRSLKSLTRKQ